MMMKKKTNPKRNDVDCTLKHKHIFTSLMILIFHENIQRTLLSAWKILLRDTLNSYRNQLNGRWHKQRKQGIQVNYGWQFNPVFQFNLNWQLNWISVSTTSKSIIILTLQHWFQLAIKYSMMINDDQWALIAAIT